MCFYGLEYPDFYTDKWYKTRKQHRCDECTKAILIGQTYLRASGKWEGEIQTFKTCEDCEELRGQITRIELSRGCSPSESTPGHGQLMEVKAEYPELLEKQASV